MKVNSALLKSDINGYSDQAQSNKDAFHKESKKFLKELAKELDLEPGSFEVRGNVGGIAGSGEITLHGEQIYVQIGSFREPSILYRTCSGRKDYSGDSNNSITMQALTDDDRMSSFISSLNNMIEGKLEAEKPAATKSFKM